MPDGLGMDWHSPSAMASVHDAIIADEAHVPYEQQKVRFMRRCDARGHKATNCIWHHFGQRTSQTFSDDQFDWHLTAMAG